MHELWRTYGDPVSAHACRLGLHDQARRLFGAGGHHLPGQVRKLPLRITGRRQ